MNKESLILRLVGDMASPPHITEQYITIAELRTVTTNGLIKTIDTNTAILSPKLISKIKPANCTPFIETAGRNLKSGDIYRSVFWLNISPANGLNRAEPLAIAWSAGNHTTIQPDQGFVCAMGLSPKLLDEEIRWHDLSRPKYDIVKNKPLSFYDFPNYTGGYVQVDRTYLSDYLSLCQKTAIQIFTITEDILIDTDIEALLDGKEYYIEEFKTYEIRLSRYAHKEDIIRLEINGYRHLMQDNIAKAKTIERSGHYWKGINGPISYLRARQEMAFEYAYVSDDVLEKYQNDDSYEVFPEFGSVKYGIHWSVDHCERVGRNAIKIELKKLYEGTPNEVIDHWNKFSIDPASINLNEENIERKARKLINRYFLFSRLMATMLKTITNTHHTAMDIINLDEQYINYTGWSEFPEYRSVSNHIKNDAFSREQFINRCKKLYILIGENLVEKNLRKVVKEIGFPTNETQTFRSFRLIELIFKYLHISDESGLHPIDDRSEILERVTELKDYEPIPELMALNAIRQLDAHKSSDAKAKLNKTLKTFGIDPNGISNNYARTCDQVYDRLTDRFTEINSWLSGLNLV